MVLTEVPGNEGTVQSQCLVSYNDERVPILLCLTCEPQLNKLSMEFMFSYRSQKPARSILL